MNCECPTRAALSLMLDQVDREYVLATAVDEARAALAAPCPCEGLREEVGRLTERAQEAMAYGRKNFDAALGFQDRALRAEAERDQLSAALAEALERVRRCWLVMPDYSKEVEAYNSAVALLTKHPESTQKCDTIAAANESKANVLP